MRSGPFVQVAGQGPADPATGEYVHLGDVRAQTRQTLANVHAVLREAGADLADVVMFRAYLSTRDDFAAFDEAYGAYLDEHDGASVRPARTTVVVGLPHPDMLVEIDALAVVG
ncbi:RidA family protein [Litorihabitans aurantiacus]|uniref:Reactive intermediate/imine deaminase n=1 Tax=Litorihabitans aurantiacus TaxID=1930061 RepID=A0AA37XF63_9MICO|nr:reactive intermediate/imine deaminase [Litorihabitans aurantiacus]